MNPILTVVVTTYNHEHYIQACLNSILTQKTNFDFNVLIGEDDSSDNTHKICLQYQELYSDKVFVIKRDRKDVIHIDGKATGRFNLIETIRMVKAKYIALIEGDDMWTDPNKLQRQIDFMEKNPGIALTFHPVLVVNEYGNRLKSAVETPLKILSGSSKLNRHIPTLSVCFKNVIKSIPKEIWISPFGDLVLWAVLAEKGAFANLGFVGGAYRVHRNGIFSELEKTQKFKKTIQARRLTLDIVGRKNRIGVYQRILQLHYFRIKNSIKTVNLHSLLMAIKDFFRDSINLLCEFVLRNQGR